jgi:hypothetical protein
MWPGIALKDPNKRYQDFLRVARPRFSGFIENLLLYDNIVVPTDDFMSLTILVGVLGEKAISALLADGALKFVRFRGSLSYIGNGGGLRPFSITKDDRSVLPQWGDTEAAIYWALDGLNVPVNIRQLSRQVLAVTQEVDLGSIEALIRDQTYRAILDSPPLRATFAIRNTNLDHLSGIEPNGVRVYGGVEAEVRESPGDEIDTVLMIARTFLERYAEQATACDDGRTTTPIGHVLAAVPGPSLSTLRQFTNIPNVADLVLAKEIETKKIISLRNTRDWRSFTSWFHQSCRDDPMRAAREYIGLLKQVPMVDKAPLKIVRLLVTTVIGLVNPIGGIAAAAGDMFGTEKLRSPSPKHFIERLEQLTKKQRGE